MRGEEENGRAVERFYCSRRLKLQKGALRFLGQNCFFFFLTFVRQSQTWTLRTWTSNNDVLSSIDIGDSLQDLVLKTEKGEDVQVADLAAEHGVVLFLVPKADTRA